MNENTDTRRIWAPHVSGGRYIGPAMEHCRCHQVYVNTTLLERVRDTVEFHPHHAKMPFISSADCTSLAESKLTEALIHQNPEASFVQIGAKHLETLRKLATLFQDCMKKPGAPPRVERKATDPSTPRVNTPEPPRVKRIINAPAPRASTHQTHAPTITSSITTIHRDIYRKYNIIQQEDIVILANLTETELTHLFSGLGVPEGQ